MSASNEEFNQDEPYAPFHLSSYFDGVTSLAELIDAMRYLVDELDLSSREGWTLTNPVDDGHVHLQSPELDD